MAPKYKLTYFDLKAIGEPIRFLLSFLGEEFEDVRVDLNQWQDSSTKSKAQSIAFGKVPMLEVDGHVLTQSVAICRFLGKKAGLAGEDDWENLQIDIIADTFVDLRLPTTAIYWEQNEDLKKSKMDTFINETLPFNLKKLDALVEANGGHLATKKLSWVDIYFAAFSEFLSGFCKVPDVTADYPNLHALMEKVFNLPQIEKWRAERPETEF